MATFSASDGGGITRQFGTDGLGTTEAPFIPWHNDPQIAAIFGETSLLDGGALRVKVEGQQQQTTVSAQVYAPPLGTVASGLIKSTAGHLLAIGATNICAEPRYLQLFNRTSAPPTTAPLATPIRAYLVGPGDFLQITDLFTATQSPGLGLFFSSGIAWAWSSTPIVTTIGAGSELLIEARFN